MRTLGNTSVANEVAAGKQADLPGRHDQDGILLTNILLIKPADEWEKILNAAHVPAARVRTVDEALEHPQFQSHTVLQDVDGLKGARPAAAFMFDQGGPKIDGPPPRFAVDTKAILNELGIKDDRISELAVQKVIAV